jgi:hypothetical protein
VVIREPQAGLLDGLRRFVLNSAKPRHAGLDPASSVFLDSRPLPTKGHATGMTALSYLIAGVKYSLLPHDGSNYQLLNEIVDQLMVSKNWY